MSMRAIVGIVLGITLCTASTVFAQQAECRADIDKFCKDVQAGEGRTLRCLREHAAELSDPCKAQLNTATQYMACIDDGIRLCPGLQASWGQLIKCLRTHTTDLSTACRQEIRESRP
jgi:hypothetical protein